MINFLKKHKNFFLGLFLVLFIFSLFILIIYFENKDIKNVKKTVLSDINLVDDSNNLYTSYTINNEGNLVGDNLLYIADFERSFDGGSIICKNNIIVVNGSPSSNISFTLARVTLAQGDYYIYDFYNSNPFVYVSESDLNYVRNSSFTLDTTRTINIGFWFSNGDTANNISLMPMLIKGNQRPLDYEPYGVWYSQTNYTNYGNVKYSEGYGVGYNQATDDIYVNNPFYNASVKYYTTLSSAEPWFTFTLDNNLLQNSNTFDVNQAVKSKLSENDSYAYYNSHDIGYFKVDFFKSFSASEMIYLVNAANPYQFDHYFTYYFDDGSQYVFHNTITSDSSKYYWQYDVSLSNTDKNGLRVVGISFRRGARDIVNSVSQSQYNIGYNDGYSVGYNKAVSNDNDTITSLNNDISNLNSRVESLTYQLNVANQNAQNDLNGLTYTMVSAVMSTPFNILHDMLNFNFFGINVFSLFTSLITLLLLIWVIKFLIGRK